MQNRIMGGDCHSYEEALGIISEYVETELSGSIPAKNKNKEDHTHVISVANSRKQMRMVVNKKEENR